MNVKIPNVAPSGFDGWKDPQTISVPFVIHETGELCFWYPEVMDYSAANRLVWAFSEAGSEAFRVDAQVVLPSPESIRSVTDTLDCLRCRPIRLKLFAEME